MVWHSDHTATLRLAYDLAGLVIRAVTVTRTPECAKNVEGGPHE